ncbi:NADH-quinone oxidoreductase subunit L [Rhodocytophaga aerolata]|uniref:NADH-quinone oxidoreductase subunit L n=1 Tax=Rhodocytophaga aerolata TaxID=455078 RepID=A0ABT8R9B9_9BACT|nr:NADH-quinone oxidoreductase subunit L [Rhodocytophaga aerolata]MDO1448301.1 NADH-quinone oxidoreductase subunit L [Rhodocytophaga aerolata]
MQEDFIIEFVTWSATLLAAIPFFIFCILFFVGTKLSKTSGWLAVIGASISFLLAVIVFFYTWPDKVYTQSIHWFTVGEYTFTLKLLLDKLSAAMLVLVSFISLLVQIYSTEYMKGDKRYSRYFAYLGLFTFSMFCIVLSGNLLLLYIGWELVGLSSYLLIGFWREKTEAALASRNAFIINRIGDTGFLLGIILVFAQFNTLDLATLTSGNLPVDNSFWLTVAGIGLFCGCIAKSAQFPLQIWLPGAMAGPTPVSALIHAATMVAAGVFLLARVFPLLNTDVLTVIAITGAITAFMGAVAALFQTDIKRLLAFSTISQLGYMVMGMGVGAYGSALFHLFTHAFFKACLFLSAGAVIHALHKVEHQLHTHFDAQDMRLMGGLRKTMPFTFICYLVSGLSLAGLPLFSGFLSKDAILTGALSWAETKGNFLWYLIPDLGFISALLTAIYVGRQLILVFGGEFRLPHLLPQLATSQIAVKDVPFAMQLPIGILAILSVFFFFSLNPVDAAYGWFLTTISVKTAQAADHSWHTFTVITSGLLAITGLALAYVVTGNTRIPRPAFLKNLSLHNWYLEDIYRILFVRTGQLFSKVTNGIDKKLLDTIIDYASISMVVLAHIFAWIDRNLVDGLVNFAAYLAGRIGALTRSVQGGRVQSYFLYTLFGLLILVVWIIL